MHPTIAALATEYKRHADARIAQGAKAYLRNQFDFFGIPTPLRRSITKDFSKQHPLPAPPEFSAFIKELWAMNEREFQYFAMESLYATRKIWRKDVVVLLEHCTVHKSWWDTVDFLASKVAGEYFRRFPEQTLPTVHRWIRHKNMWMNRVAILYQLSYKKETNTDLLTEAIVRHAASKEFFHQKAIGWALRQYSYTNPQWVQTFINTHSLQPLSVREGLKALRRIEANNKESL